MDNENDNIVESENNEIEGEGNESEKVSVPKEDYEKLNQTLGSLKREIKDLKKPKEESKEETPTENQKQPDNNLLEKTFLRAAQITAEDEVEFALSTAKKWGVEIDKLVDDEDFKVKLERMRTQKSNELATSEIRGSSGSPQTKNTAEYWIAKGVPPTVTDVPDRKARAKIARAMMANTKSGKKFYNE